MAQALGAITGTQVAVVGLSNDYLGYFASEHEFAKQHYEGASTLYGPDQAQFAIDHLVRLARALVGEQALPSQNGTPAVDYPPTRVLRLAEYRELLGDRDPCQAERWRIEGVRIKPHGYQLRWVGWSDEERCEGPVPSVSVECERDGAFATVDSDAGLSFLVERRGGDRWRALWWPAEGLQARCRFRVERPEDGAPLLSRPFNVQPPRTR
jgi:hypothetical protein